MSRRLAALALALAGCAAPPHHGFDSSRPEGLLRIPNVGAGRRGATVGPNPIARENARANVRRELAEMFGG